MKKIVFFLFTSTIFLSFTTGDEKKKKEKEISENSEVTLIVIGHVTNASFDFKKAKYRLYRDNRFASGDFTDNFGSMELHLMRNSHYLLEISAKNFISKKVYFNTFLPEKNKTIRYFDFEVELIFSDEEKIPCEFDVPFAVVYFDAEKNEFDYDKSYTEKMIELEKDFILK